MQIIRLFALSSQSAPYRSQTRIAAIDLVRVLAMVLMIEGHTLDALLNRSYFGTLWFDIWTFFRGYTAPTFMMLSGFSFALATNRHWEEHLAFTPTSRRRVLRFTSFALLGYALHFPVHTFRELPWLTVDHWRGWLQADVLQCISISLLLLQLLVFLCRTPERFTRAAFGLTAVVTLAAPLVWWSGLSTHLPLFMAAYVDGATGSAFPLIPWAAYLSLGAGLGCLYLRYREGNNLHRFAYVTMWTGMAAMTVGFVVHTTVLERMGEFLFWKTSPTLVLIRGGMVLTVMGWMLRVTRIMRFSSPMIQTLAQESLFVYFVHVCILYGSIWNPGLRQYLAGMNLGGSLLVAAALITTMLALALTWSWFKKQKPLPVYAFRVAVALAAAWSLM